MNEHVDMLIADLDEQITALQSLRSNLVAFGAGARIPRGAGPSDIVGMKKPGATPPREGGKRKYTRRAPEMRNREVPLYQQAAPAVAKLPEPFGAKEMAAALKKDMKSAANFIARMKAIGWLEGADGWGQYKRTKLFGGHSRGQEMLADIHKEIDKDKTHNLYD